MCLGAYDLRNVRKIKSILDSCMVDLIQNHKDILCKDPSRDFTRSTFYSPKTILSFLLRMESKSAESELINIIDCQRISKNYNAAFLMKRKKLTQKCMPFLFNSFNEAIMNDPSLGLNKHLVKECHLLAADGSDVNIAYNPFDPETYVKQDGKRGFNQIHLNALYDVCTGMYMSASVQGIHKKQERKALIDMISSLKDIKKSIITADRGYESFNVFAALIESGAKYVIRLKDIDSNGIISAYDLKNEEFDVYLSTRLTKRRTKETLSDIDTYTILPYYTDFDFFDDDIMYDIKVRIVRFLLPNGNYVCVATNLDPNEFGKKELCEIYHRRWGLETAFRKLKYSIGLVNFHSYKMEYILQELYARLTMYNFTASIVKTLEPLTSDYDSTNEDHASNDEEETKEVSIAFSQAVTVCRKLLIKRTLDYIRNAIEIIKGHTFIKKTGQAFERKVKPQSYRPFCYKTS
jgi:hypothetical protein